MQEGKVNLFGKSFTISQLKEYVADISAVGGVRPYTLLEGSQRGVLAVDVWTGSGLEYTVVPDRGMNICNFRYGGIGLDWSSPTGLTSPFMYEAQRWRWMRSFNGGLLHTCGLDNVGEPCVDGDESYGGHGRISNTPATQVSWKTDTENEPYAIDVAGKCRLVSLPEENLLMERKITSEIAGKRIVINDRIQNLGFNKTPIFLLYHCNFGFPLICEDTKLTIPAKKAVDRAGTEVTDFKRIEPPSDSPDEQVLYPVMDGDSVEISLYNPKLQENGLGVYMKYDRAELPHLTIWKFFQKRSYVLAIEPGTCRVEGRVTEKKQGRAIFLEPDESLSVTLEIGVLVNR